MKLYALYRIHNMKTNMDYIGWSTNPVSRVFNQHEKTNSYIGNAISLYGWDVFDVDILHLVKTKEEACKLEIEEIAKHNCQAPNGYNLTAGGEGGDTFTNSFNKKEKQEKMKKPRGKRPDVAKRNKENPMRGKKNPFYGKHHSKETVKKIKEARKNQKNAIENNPVIDLKRQITNLKNRLNKLE